MSLKNLCRRLWVSKLQALPFPFPLHPRSGILQQMASASIVAAPLAGCASPPPGITITCYWLQGLGLQPGLALSTCWQG